MSLEINTVLTENIPALFVNDPDIQAEVLGRFRSDLEQIDASGELTIDALSELVFPNSYSHEHIAETVEAGLSRTVAVGTSYETRMFEPGATAVELSSKGTVRAVHHNPYHEYPGLDHSQNHLRWALLHAAYAAISSGAKEGAPESRYGYPYIENVIRRSKGLEPVANINQLPFKDLHHLGGAVDVQNPARHNSLGTRLCGVSGVLLNKFLAESLIWEPYTYPKGIVESPETEIALRVIARQTKFNGALDGFQGNLFAGSVDSALARFILLDGIERVEPAGLDHVVEEVMHGINVH